MEACTGRCLRDPFCWAAELRDGLCGLFIARVGLGHLVPDNGSKTLIVDEY